MASGMDKLETLRPAGLVERWHIARCELGFDSLVIASARYTSSSGTTLDKIRLQNAMGKLIVRHPSLATQIVKDSSGKPQFVRLRFIDLERAIEGPFPSSLEGLYNHYLTLTMAIGVDEPLWRLGFCEDGTVAFVFHHAIGDGQSSIAFHKTLLDLLNTSSPSTAVLELPPPLIPAAEAFMDISVPWPKLLHELYNVLAPKSWKNKSQTWTGNPVVTEPTLRTNISFWELDASESENLLKLCRQHNCTLTSFFQVLGVEALSHVLAMHSPELLKDYSNIHTTVSISLRRFTGTPLSVICDQASKLHCYTPIASTAVEDGVFLPDRFPWDRAVEFGATVHTRIEDARQELGCMGWLFGHFQEYHEALLGKKRESTFTISNIGRFPRDEKDKVAEKEWKIGSMFFGQCDATAGAAMKINVAGAPDGSLGSTFTWGESALDDDIARPFIETVKTWTVQLLDGVSSSY